MSFCCRFLSLLTLQGLGQAVLCTVRSVPVGIVVVEGLCVLALIAVLVLSKKRLVKIFSGCGIEICAWQICKTVAGSDALLTRIMTWLTAAVLIVLTLTIVNSIKWRQSGDGQNDTDHPDTPHP